MRSGLHLSQYTVQLRVLNNGLKSDLIMVEFGKGDLTVSLKVVTTLATGAYTGTVY